MAKTYKVLILGASYGSLLGTKLAMAGHDVTLVCLPAEAEAINRDGAVVRLPVKGRGQVEIRSKTLPGKVSASGTEGVDPSAYDLVGLAMQEPQYRVPAVRDLLDKVGRAKVPMMSIMNMPPLTYLRRIPGVNADALKAAYTDPTVWQSFDSAESTQMLRDMQAGIEAVRWDVGGEKVELPVKLKVHDSVFVPLAKWAMLLTGNYRCVTKDGPRSIKDAVHSNLEESRSVYDWVKEVCVKLGAAPDDLVPFEKYAAAGQGLSRPSSAARALYAGAPYIERVDRLVQAVAAQKGMRHPVVDATVAPVDAQLAQNPKA